MRVVWGSDGVTNLAAFPAKIKAFGDCYFPGDYLDINECFVEKPNFQLTVDSMTEELVDFKDDCLRSCLRSYLRGTPCVSAEHHPKDNVGLTFFSEGRFRRSKLRRKWSGGETGFS
ncbi:hypothetical protein COOONC_02085 [Cooperia oncophora]